MNNEWYLQQEDKTEKQIDESIPTNFLLGGKGKNYYNWTGIQTPPRQPKTPPELKSLTKEQREEYCTSVIMDRMQFGQTIEDYTQKEERDHLLTKRLHRKEAEEKRLTMSASEPIIFTHTCNELQGHNCVVKNKEKVFPPLTSPHHQTSLEKLLSIESRETKATNDDILIIRSKLLEGTSSSSMSNKTINNKLKLSHGYLHQSKFFIMSPEELHVSLLSKTDDYKRYWQYQTIKEKKRQFYQERNLPTIIQQQRRTYNEIIKRHNCYDLTTRKEPTPQIYDRKISKLDILKEKETAQEKLKKLAIEKKNLLDRVKELKEDRKKEKSSSKIWNNYIKDKQRRFYKQYHRKIEYVEDKHGNDVVDFSNLNVSIKNSKESNSPKQLLSLKK